MKSDSGQLLGWNTLGSVWNQQFLEVQNGSPLFRHSSGKICVELWFLGCSWGKMLSENLNSCGSKMDPLLLAIQVNMIVFDGQYLLGHLLIMGLIRVFIAYAVMQIPSSASGKKFWFNNWKVSTYNFSCWQSILSFISAAEEGSYCQNLILRKNKTLSSTDIEIIQSQWDMEYTYIRETLTSVFTQVGIIIPVWKETVHFSNASIELELFLRRFYVFKFC